MPLTTIEFTSPARSKTWNQKRTCGSTLETSAGQARTRGSDMSARNEVSQSAAAEVQGGSMTQESGPLGARSLEAPTTLDGSRRSSSASSTASARVCTCRTWSRKSTFAATPQRVRSGTSSKTQDSSKPPDRSRERTFSSNYLDPRLTLAGPRRRLAERLR